MIDGRKLIVSLTTYPARLEYLRKAFPGLLGQAGAGQVDSFIINLDDVLTPDQVKAYDEFKAMDPRVEVKLRDGRWRSANKLVWTYRDDPDAVIVCFDDDKAYPGECLKQLLDAWRRDPDCIIAQEVNPAVVVGEGRIEYLNAVDVKLGQKEFGKYLSNACLFPPRCFSEDLYDYDSFQYVTNGMHDELWFWIASTLNGTRCVGLDYTFSYEADGIAFEYDQSALTHVNADPKTIRGYNDRLNEVFGKRLFGSVDCGFVDFPVRRENTLAVYGTMPWINRLYGGFRVRFVAADGLAPSWISLLAGSVKQLKWRQVAIVGERSIR